MNKNLRYPRLEKIGVMVSKDYLLRLKLQCGITVHIREDRVDRIYPADLYPEISYFGELERGYDTGFVYKDHSRDEEYFDYLNTHFKDYFADIRAIFAMRAKKEADFLYICHALEVIYAHKMGARKLISTLPQPIAEEILCEF